MTIEDNFSGVTIPESQDEGFDPPKDINSMKFEPPIELDSEEEELFENLLFVGKLEKVFKFAGHRIYLTTPTTDIELQIGLLTKPFINSDAYVRAFKTAVVAAFVQEIDGQPLYQSLKANEDIEYVMRRKFEIVSEYYPVIIDMIYSKTRELEQEMMPLVEKLGKTLG